MGEEKSGWQQKPIVPEPSLNQCPHLGVFFASLSLRRHPEGHEYLCSCGQIFVVVSNGGEDKKLVPREE